MIAVTGLFEVHLPVADLKRAVAFYRDVLGLTVARVFPNRGVAFFWVGPAGEAMLGLWAVGDGPQRLALHTAFRSTVDHVLEATSRLRAAGVEPLDFSGEPADEPVVLAWMPAVAIYCRDPDGHLLEYLAMLPNPPRPDAGVMSWSAWSGLPLTEVSSG